MMPELIAGTIGLSIALLVLAVFRTNHSRLAERQLARLAQADATADPMATSFAHRALHPLTSRITGILMSVLPGRILNSVRRELQTAGAPMSLRSFLMIWVLFGLVLPLFVVLMLVVAGSALSGRMALAPLVWVALGTYLPWLMLRRRSKARATAIRKRLPDAIDLIITNIEAGLGLQAALLTVSERMSGPAAEEFGRAVREISLGMDRTAVFEAMAERSGVQEMRLFARAVAQSDRTGFPIARILRNHAGEIRERRRQVAREKAAKVPVKIILPTAIFIFPTLFLVILGPIGLYAASRFS